ncbi:transporter substrate-binding domain-containing protein [Chitinimonas viridis]|uniref:Transporter substrate-binding domain-containing protein n=1 Tax=Chitinimonas viridis TaxID=664880 RepID=A0ABT8B2B3_9NEIS|nr:transporter substrate-binding domain-containing protein [Chitinimonas viridis]MDN3576369.1 transporter substrate-binding domain-containing protein [Chitinimonas viridis]
MRPALPIGFTLLVTLAALPARAELRTVLCECDSPPLVEFAPGSYKPTGGLIKDMSELIARQMGVKASYVVLSRKRIDLALTRGEVDLLCFANPAWTSLADKLHWTEEIVPQVERVMMDKTRAARTNNVNDLKGMRIGLIHGFHYPAIDPLILTGDIKPVYEKDHESNFKLLERDAVDGLISADLQIAHYLRNPPASGRPFGMSNYVVSSTPTHCAVPKASPIKVERVMQAVQQLKAQGAFDKLLNQYRVAQPAR